MMVRLRQGGDGNLTLACKNICPLRVGRGELSRSQKRVGGSSTPSTILAPPTSACETAGGATKCDTSPLNSPRSRCSRPVKEKDGGEQEDGEPAKTTAAVTKEQCNTGGARQELMRSICSYCNAPTCRIE